METLGDFLRTVRESEGRSLKTIAEKTRINADYLHAMEENRWDRFSSEVIARGFVRSYAVCLGLDEREVLSRFDDTVHPIYQEKEEAREPFREQMIRVKPQVSGKSRSSRLLAMLAVGAVLLILYILGSMRFQARMDQSAPVQTGGPVTESEPAPSVPEPAMTEPKPVPDEAVNVPGASPEESVPETPAVPEPSPTGGTVSVPSPSGLMTLVIEAVEPTWIAVRIDDHDTKEVTLQPGDKVVWVAEKQFMLNVGNAGGADFKLNGKPLAPFGPSGAVVKNIVLRAEPAEQPGQPDPSEPAEPPSNPSGPP
jgi:cytoskeleton protein RodZ